MASSPWLCAPGAPAPRRGRHLNAYSVRDGHEYIRVFYIYYYYHCTSENPKVDFSHIFGNNSAPKNVSLCLEALQGPILLFFSQISPQTLIFPIFWVKKVGAKFFSLKNMLNLATFLLLAHFFSGTISRGPLTRRKRYFSFFTKKRALKIFFQCKIAKFWSLFHYW